MYRNRTALAVFCVFLVIVCLVVVRGLRVTQADPASPRMGFASERGRPFTDADLADLPRTWYCLTPWTEDPAKEHQGIAFSAWRLFLALNWPGEFHKNNNGTPAWIADDKLDKLNKAGKYPRWSSWHSPETLRDALKTCGKPDPVAQGAPLPPPPDWTHRPDALASGVEAPRDQGEHKNTPPCVFDQNGEIVGYEIRMRQEGWVNNLYEVACPAAVGSGADASGFSFQYGQCQGKGPSNSPDSYDFDGAVAVKLAWKVLSEGEIKSGRFLQRNARVREACDDKARFVVKTVGLVGFNITQKTNHYSKWIWSTFEHIDNLAPGIGATAASFHDPRCKDCVANTSQQLRSDSRCRTQITQDRPIPDDIRSLNEKMSLFLRGRSVLQYYRLVGVQYVSRASPSSSPDAPPTPAALRNPVIETYNVARAGENPPQPPRACFGHPKGEDSSCIGCHQLGGDLSFVPGLELCNCKDKAHRWSGDTVCRRLLGACGEGASR